MNYPDAKQLDSLEDGREFQDFVMDVCYKKLGLLIQCFSSKRYQFDRGESIQGVEIKLDKRCTETGRLSIEIEEKTRADQEDWISSGIYTEDNTWLYIQGNYEIIFIFFKQFLVCLHKSHRYLEDENSTIKKFYLPLEDARKYGHVLEP